jgi:hypothetical protein
VRMRCWQLHWHDIGQWLHGSPWFNRDPLVECLKRGLGSRLTRRTGVCGRNGDGNNPACLRWWGRSNGSIRIRPMDLSSWCRNSSSDSLHGTPGGSDLIRSLIELLGLSHQEVGADVALDMDHFVSSLPLPQAYIEVFYRDPTGECLF